jgi:hypothetical protein
MEASQLTDIRKAPREQLDARESKRQSVLNADPIKIVEGEVLTVEEAAIQEINERHARVNNLAKDALENAIRIGELLTEQRHRCKHGEWLPWLTKNTDISPKTADRYRALYKNREKFVSVTNLAEAYQLCLPRPKSSKTGKNSNSRNGQKLYRVDEQCINKFFDEFLTRIESIQHAEVLQMIVDEGSARLKKLKG